MKRKPNSMKLRFALTIALALASLGVSVYAQTADQASTQTHIGKKHKQHRQKKETKQKETHSSTQK